MKISKYLLIFSYNVMGDKMEKKLPKVFANTINRKINNNEKIFRLKNINDSVNIERKDTPMNNNINEKINKIFKSTKYVYKMNVEVTTKEGTSEIQIIGKSNGNLITLDNKLIPIKEIINIEEI